MIDAIRKEASDLIQIGVCDVEPFTETLAELNRRKASGESGHLTFTYNRPEVSTDIRSSFPWAQRIIVGAATYLPEAGTPGDSTGGEGRPGEGRPGEGRPGEGRPGEGRPGEGRIARFSTEDHYIGLRASLDAIGEFLRAQGWRAEVLVDDNRLVDRAAAVRAGIGWWGKNTMVLTPKYGPWILLGSVVTDALIETTQPMERSCGTCSACIPACPTNAIVAPGVLDARLCLAAILQAPGDIPLELREAVGDRLYGCDDCLDACPPGERLLESATEPRGWVSAEAILAADDDELLTDFDRFYIPRRNPNYLRRNALVVLGNNPGPDSRGTVSRFVDHPDPMVSEHAAWALGRIEATC